MKKPIFFDHIEVHVSDIPAYCEFLVKMFQGGRYKTISDTGTSMFISDEGLNIEIKKKEAGKNASAAGFCNPCLRTERARDFIEKNLGLKIDRSLNNPDGDVHFFTDHEGVVWHIKDYLNKDQYVNW